MHPAQYVSKAWMRRFGKPGRSLGCLAVDPAESARLINKIRGGSVVLNYTGE
jgi:L,D-transpeptidase catalytic domain